MRLATIGLAGALLLAGTPALATQTLECGSPGRRGFELVVSVGSGGGVDLVRIVDGRRELVATGFAGANPRIVRGVMDEAGRLSVRIVGGDGRTPVASLDLSGGHRARAGTLRYRGRAWRVSCRWEPQD